MKKILLISCLILLWSPLSAQVHEIQQTRNAISTVNAIGAGPAKSAPMVRGFDHSYKGVLGTPYMSEDWKKGMLEQKNGDLFHDVYLRYNMVDDLIEMKNLNGKVVGFTKREVIAFRIYNSEESFLTFRVFPEPVLKKKGDHNFYAQVMNEGAIQLLVRRRKYFVPKTEAVTPYHTNTNDSYKFKADKYYVIFDGEKTPMLLKRSKKSLLTIMDKYEDEIAAFMKQNLLSAGNDHHLAMIIDRYNELEVENEEGE